MIERLVSVTLLLALPALCQDYAAVVDNGVAAKMRDGVTLVADVYHPRAEGKFPVILQRTPYNRAGAASEAVKLVAHGYVVVIQDTRGRFDSGGEFYPFRHEAADGYDTVEWAAALPYANGKVGMFGGSYVGATQWLAATTRPPHLVAVLPYVTASEYYEGWTYQGGALMQWFASSWTSGLAVDTMRKHLRSTPKTWVERLPVSDYQLIEAPPAASAAPYFRDWLAHDRDDEYWRPWKISDHYGEMKVKSLNAGGWHDIFLKGTIRNYTGMRESSPERAGQRLMLGPWAHAATSPDGKIGDVTFGKAAVLDMTGMTLAWCDYALKGIENEYATGAPVKLFVMGENAWRDEQEFPLKRTRYTDFYLLPRTLAAAEGDAPPEEYEYDPEHPTPTIGGRLCCANQFLAPGPADQRPLESRKDVLVYSTPTLKWDTEVTGYIRLKLYASSSAVDTDFTALLADVEPDGYSRLLTDGIVRAKYRKSTAKAELVKPGEIVEYDIDLWATSNLFKAGHQIRLYLSSSNFPRFDRNLNTGEPPATSTRVVKAAQRIYHDAQHPSRLVLPVIPR